MKYRQFFAVCLVALAAVTGCEKPENAAAPTAAPFEPKQAQPRLPTIQLWLGPEQMTAEMAVTDLQVMTGMMFRTNMAENEGMIFVLGPPKPAHFWMKNCHVPLSVAYIDPEGVIQEIHDLQPHNTNTVNSVSPNIAFALETPQGWFQHHNIQSGMTVRTERGSLMDTFYRKH